MSIAYRTKVNKRQIGAEQLILSEQHIVGISGAFTLTANKIRLVEVPLQEMPSTVSIPGFTEVLAAPGPFEFVVDYGIGRITFNAARSGDTVFVTYKGRGSEVDSEDVNELQIPVGIALNQNGSLVNGIVHPNNISTVVTDDFLFPRNVTATAAIAGGSSLTVVTNIITTTGNILAGGTSLSLNTAEVGSPTLDAFFTVKRGSSGDTSLKWNESIDAWEFLNDLGSPTLQIFNDGHITLSGPLELGVGSAAAPSYSFSTDPDTGMYENGANVLAFSTGGSLKWEITSSGVWQANVAFPNTVIQANDGTLALPSYGFATQGGVGMYRIGSNHLGFVTNSLLQLDITTSLISTQIPISVLTSVGGTSATFSDSTNSTLRIEHQTLNVLTFDVNASNFFKFSVAGTEIARLTNGQAQFSGGTTLFPGISFLTEPASGISLPFAQTLAFSLDGVGEVARFTPIGDFQLQDSEKVIFDGVGNVFLRHTGAAGFVGQSAVDSSFTLKSASYFSLASNQSATGLASGTITVINYSGLSGKTVTVNGFTKTEGVDWFAATDNDTTATSLSTAISTITGVSSFTSGNVVTILATTFGTAGNTITLATNDPTDLLLSGPTLLGGGNTNTNEPAIGMNIDGSMDVLNSTQGDSARRSLFIRIASDVTSGAHRTAQIIPAGLGLGIAATGSVIINGYTFLSGAVLTVGTTPLTEGTDWIASISDSSTATSLASAINALTFVNASAVGSVITVTAALPGKEGNSIALTSSNNTHMISSEFLHTGSDDFVLAFGYHANGTAVDSATIDVHNSLPLSISINNTEVVNIAPSLVTIRQAVDVQSHQIHNVTDPTAAQDAATKFYVDSVAAGFDPKASCRVTTTANLTATASGSGVGKTLTNSGVQAALVLDGITMVVNDRVLVKDQTTAKDNGIYTVTNIGSVSTNWVLTRATDFDGSPSNEVSGGNFSFVEQGTTYAGTGWVVVWNGNIVVDTDPINWTKFSNPSTAFTQYATDPVSPTLGQVWFNTTDFQFKGYNGTSIVILG